MSNFVWFELFANLCLFVEFKIYNIIKMRIPHLIDINAYEAYKPLDVIIKCLVKETGRKITTENCKWNDDFLPPLKNICLQTISKNFEKYPVINFLPELLQLELIGILSSDINLQLAVFVIDNEYYWEKRYNTHFPSKKIKTHLGWTWKCIYLEQYLAKVCEETEPEYKDEEFQTMQNLLDLCSNYVHILNITQLQERKPPRVMLKKEYPNIFPDTHINFEHILRKLPFLTELHISFGMNDIGVNYAPHKFLVDPKDCEQLGLAAGKMKHLKILEINNSKIGDVHVKHMVRNLLTNTSLEILEFPNCQIGDMGAKCIALLLNIHPKIKFLNMRCNKIGTEGVLGLAWSLIVPEGTYLDRLDLSLNTLNDQGILNLCRALIRGSALKELSISGCGISGVGAITFAMMLKLNKSIEYLDISENDFGVEGGEKILESMKFNNKLIDIKMDDTNIPDNLIQTIKHIVKQNRIWNRMVDVDSHLDYSRIRHITKFTRASVNVEDPPMDML